MRAEGHERGHESGGGMREGMKDITRRDSELISQPGLALNSPSLIAWQ